MSETLSPQTETVESLRVKVRELEDLLVQLGHEVVDATMDAAQARIDALRVQADLGRMDARDEMGDRFVEVEEVLAHTRDRFAALTDESSDVGQVLVEGLRSARSDLQAAVELAQERISARRG
jgi:AmiR/NasT family two-component response regulator